MFADEFTLRVVQYAWSEHDRAWEAVDEKVRYYKTSWAYEQAIVRLGHWVAARNTRNQSQDFRVKFYLETV